LTYIVLAAALFEGASWAYGMRELSRTKGKQNLLTAIHRGKGPDMLAVIFEDSAALLGLAVAFLGVFLSHLTGSHYYDGAASPCCRRKLDIKVDHPTAALRCRLRTLRALFSGCTGRAFALLSAPSQHDSQGRDRESPRTLTAQRRLPTPAPRW
jgi:hypothetical protein